MTFPEMKKKVYSMIEELSAAEALTDDPDIDAKMVSVTNQVMNELSRIKKITATPVEIDVTTTKVFTFSDIADDVYQIIKIYDAEYEIIGKNVIFSAESEGTATVYYYKYPTAITETDNDDYEFELDADVLEIMPYGVAGDLLKSDVSANYGNNYSNRYESLKQTIDIREHKGSVFIQETSIDL